MAIKRKVDDSTIEKDSTPKRRKSEKKALPDVVEDSQITDEPQPAGTTNETQSTEDEALPEGFFVVREILDEEVRTRKKKETTWYLVQWEGVDPETGKDFPPNWEPEENVFGEDFGSDVRRKWEEKKQSTTFVQKSATPVNKSKIRPRGKATPRISKTSKTPPSNLRTTEKRRTPAKSPAPVARQPRRKRVISSSPDPGTGVRETPVTKEAPENSTQQAEATEGAEEQKSPRLTPAANITSIDDTEQPSAEAEISTQQSPLASPPLRTEALIERPRDTLVDSPQVFVTQNTQFDPKEFTAVSTQPQSQSTPFDPSFSSSGWTTINDGSQKQKRFVLPSSSPSDSPRVVPDTQSLHDSSSYVASTQKHSDSNNTQITQDLPSPPEEPEDFTQYDPIVDDDEREASNRSGCVVQAPASSVSPRPSEQATHIPTTDLPSKNNLDSTTADSVKRVQAQLPKPDSKRATPRRDSIEFESSEALRVKHAEKQPATPQLINNNSRQKAQKNRASISLNTQNPPSSNNSKPRALSIAQLINSPTSPNEAPPARILAPSVTPSNLNNSSGNLLSDFSHSPRNRNIVPTTESASAIRKFALQNASHPQHSRTPSRDSLVGSHQTLSRSRASSPDSDADSVIARTIGSASPVAKTFSRSSSMSEDYRRQITGMTRDELRAKHRADHPEDWDENIPLVQRLETWKARQDKQREERRRQGEQTSNAPQTSTTNDTLKAMDPSSAPFAPGSSSNPPAPIPPHVHGQESSTRSPSAIPGVLPQSSGHPQTSLHDTTNMATVGSMTELGGYSQKSTATSSSLDSHILIDPQTQLLETILPIAMGSAWLRDCYVSLFRKRGARFVEDFVNNHCASDDPKAHEALELIGQAQDLMTRFDDVTDNSQAENPRDVAILWETHGPKFQFLGEFLRLCAHLKLHIAILCRPGAIPDALSTYLKGKQVPFTRIGTSVSSQKNSGRTNVFVTLVPTGEESSKAVFRPADLIVCWDNSADFSSKHYASLRRTVHDEVAPVLSLVVLFTVEHADRCIIPKVSGLNRLKALVTCSSQLLRTEFMDPDEQFRGPQFSATVHAQVLARFVSEPREFGRAINLREFNPPALPNIHEFVTDETGLSGSSGSEDSQNSALEHGTQEQPMSRKRQHEPADADDTPKRSRVGEHTAATGSTVDVSIMHITDSVGKPTQPPVAGNVSGDIPMADAPTSSNPPGSSSRSGDTSLLRSQLETAKATIRDLDAAMSGLQLRYETQDTAARTITRTLDSANAEIGNLKQQLVKRDATIAAKNESIRDLQSKLNAATASLAASPDADKAEIARLMKKSKDDEHARFRAEKAADSEKSMMEFTRTQYQDASSKARDLALRVDELEKELTELRPKAEGKALQLRQASNAAFVEKALKEKQGFKQQIENLMRLVQEKDEEIRVLRSSRAGVGTRAGSAAPGAGGRSPKVSGMAMAMGVSGRGSRASSPLGGGARMRELRHGNNP